MHMGKGMCDTKAGTPVAALHHVALLIACVEQATGKVLQSSKGGPITAARHASDVSAQWVTAA